MPTYAQLGSEQWWGREVTPPSIAAVGEAVRRRYGLAANAIGTKGDNKHLSGGHRSPEWVINSRHSTRRSSDGSLLCSDGSKLVPGHRLWETCRRNLRALDVTLGTVARMVEVCSRLNAALRAGRLPTVRRFWGNVDGDRVVDGFDNLTNRASTSDSSHLWHLHLEFYPNLAHTDHAAVIAALLGKDDDMDTTQAQLLWNAAWFVQGLATGQDPIVIPANGAYGAKGGSFPNKVAQAAKAATQQGPAVTVDVTMLAEALKHPAVAAVFAEAVRPVVDDVLNRRLSAAADADRP